MNDIWVCTSCKSINRTRSSSCYGCGARQEAAAEPEDALGADHRAINAMAERTVAAYHSTRPLAMLTGALLAFVAVLGLTELGVRWTAYPALRQAFMNALDGGRAPDVALAGLGPVGTAGLATLTTVLSLAALVSFALWLAIATRNVPALGGGHPDRGPLRVFVYTLIPVFNLYRVPGMLQDVLYRVDSRGGGMWMVIFATLGLVGSRFVSWIGSFVIVGNGVRDLLAATTPAARLAVFGGILDQSFALEVAVAVMVAGGTVLLVVLLARVENRCLDRDEEIRSAGWARSVPTAPATPRAFAGLAEPPAAAAPASDAAPATGPAYRFGAARADPGAADDAALVDPGAADAAPSPLDPARADAAPAAPAAPAPGFSHTPRKWGQRAAAERDEGPAED